MIPSTTDSKAESGCTSETSTDWPSTRNKRSPWFLIGNTAASTRSRRRATFRCGWTKAPTSRFCVRPPWRSTTSMAGSTGCSHNGLWRTPLDSRLDDEHLYEFSDSTLMGGLALEPPVRDGLLGRGALSRDQAGQNGRHQRITRKIPPTPLVPLPVRNRDSPYPRAGAGCCYLGARDLIWPRRPPYPKASRRLTARDAASRRDRKPLPM